MNNKMKKYEIDVIRRYYVVDTFTVYSDSLIGAEETAEELSGDKDYTGRLQLDEVEVDCYSEEEDDRKWVNLTYTLPLSLQITWK